MDPTKATAEWLRSTVFKEEAIRPQPPRSTERLPSMLRAARALENGPHQSWQSRESVFMKQGKLLAGYEDDYGYQGGAACYYPTYQALTDRQLRGYFSWRTRLRCGEVCETSLSFAFLYIYELINQIGVTDPMDGYRRLVDFRDTYGQIAPTVLPYLKRWLLDYAVYYELDAGLLADMPQVLQDRSVTVLEHVREREPDAVMSAVKQLAPSWLGRSKFYAAHQEDMDAVIVRVLRRVSDHYAARCKSTMADQYFGGHSLRTVSLFDAAVFCDPLKRRSCEYAVDEQRVYRCRNGFWSLWARVGPPSSKRSLGALVKTIDSVMRQEYGDRHPVKGEVNTKWVRQLIQEEVRGLLAEKEAAEAKKLVINYGQLTRIRRDAAITREKLIVDEEADLTEEPAPAPAEPPQEQLSLLAPPQEPPAPARQGGDTPLSPPEYRLLQCLLYGGDTGWVQAGGHLLSVLVDGINEKLYDAFLDCVLDDAPQPVQDYIDDLKEMVRP